MCAPNTRYRYGWGGFLPAIFIQDEHTIRPRKIRRSIVREKGDVKHVPARPSIMDTPSCWSKQMHADLARVFWGLTFRVGHRWKVESWPFTPEKNQRNFADMTDRLSPR